MRDEGYQYVLEACHFLYNLHLLTEREIAALHLANGPTIFSPFLQKGCSCRSVSHPQPYSNIPKYHMLSCSGFEICPWSTHSSKLLELNPWKQLNYKRLENCSYWDHQRNSHVIGSQSFALLLSGPNNSCLSHFDIFQTSSETLLAVWFIMMDVESIISLIAVALILSSVDIVDITVNQSLWYNWKWRPQTDTGMRFFSTISLGLPTWRNSASFNTHPAPSQRQCYNIPSSHQTCNDIASIKTWIMRHAVPSQGQWASS